MKEATIRSTAHLLYGKNWKRTSFLSSFFGTASDACSLISAKMEYYWFLSRNAQGMKVLCDRIRGVGVKALFMPARRVDTR